MAINLPDFYEDPYYTSSQETLEPLGQDILAGDIPEYYSGIGESESPQFEQMLAMLTRDVKTGATEDMARRGIRGGRGTEVMSKTVGDIGTKLRYDDYLRSLKGKEYLFGQGRGITEGVRGAGLEIGGQRNVFEMQKARTEYQMEQDALDREQAEDDAWINMLSSGIGTVGNVAGMAFMGGFPLGSAATSVMDATKGGTPSYSAYDVFKEQF